MHWVLLPIEQSVQLRANWPLSSLCNSATYVHMNRVGEAFSKTFIVQITNHPPPPTHFSFPQLQPQCVMKWRLDDLCKHMPHRWYVLINPNMHTLDSHCTLKHYTPPCTGSVRNSILHRLYDCKCWYRHGVGLHQIKSKSKRRASEQYQLTHHSELERISEQITHEISIEKQDFSATDALFSSLPSLLIILTKLNRLVELAIGTRRTNTLMYWQQRIIYVRTTPTPAKAWGSPDLFSNSRVIRCAHSLFPWDYLKESSDLLLFVQFLHFSTSHAT